MRWFLLTMLAIVVALPAQAREIFADLSVRAVDIDHKFVGLDILMFGVRNDNGRVVIVVRGPKQDVVVRKKSRVLGIWTNTESAEFDDVYSLYGVASTGPLGDVNNDELMVDLGIGLDTLPLPIEATSNDLVFRRALIERKQDSGLYSTDTDTVSFWGETLFRTVLRFPKNIASGTYLVEAYLFSDGRLTAMQSTPVEVQKIGFHSVLNTFAHENGWLYGLLCVGLAVLMGWGANILLGRA